ncbi:MAG: hypothetical protein AAB391_01480 [Patescibacteria group bacterium]
MSAYTPEEAYQAHEAVRQVFNATVAQCAVDGLKVIGSHEAWRNTFGMTSSLPTLYDLMVETGWRKQGSESYRAEVRRNLAMMLRETAMVQADLSRVRFGIRNSSHLIVDSGPNYEKADAMIRITENVFAGVARFFHSSSTNTFLVSDPHGFIFLHALKANVKALGFWEVLAEEADLAGDEESSLVRL